LLVEDDLELCEEISEVLEYEGYITDIANDTKTGVEYLEKKKYDVLILDLKLPGNGYDMLRKLGRKELKIFIITASPIIVKESTKIVDDTEKEKMNLLKMADDVINKPFNIEYLLNRIRNI
jgi:DNA-binding response OmpR family regulator